MLTNLIVQRKEERLKNVMELFSKAFTALNTFILPCSSLKAFKEIHAYLLLCAHKFIF